ncbi:ArsR family transcriptional regulator [Streptomyces sp. AJS327]|uniref:ArsR/SmtB family transcription factor n=1 Tax=Streptomyces sp. AJS327 TaxID=2545265 RepID=UPI0015DFE888|nr:helix-turn-helix domain-containing protein [Streptomyces sp. AJS327]MBA0050370.1 ArsR family transcriptional regulator [Streptomyces sp. AJS327]
MAAPANRVTDLAVLKVLTHPLRVQLWHALHAARTATASQLAEEVDEAVSLVSYHLRRMAEHGLITEAEGRGTDGRERWWRQADERGISFRTGDFSDRPESAAVVSQVMRRLLEARSERYAAFLDQRDAWPAEWADASISSDYAVRLTAEELNELSREMGELVHRWIERGRAADRAGDTAGRENVALHLYGFPLGP